MTISRIIAIITLLLTCTLPLSALAMGSEAELNALIAAAEQEVTATPAWQKGSAAERQRLSELAVRRTIITTVQARFDKSQLEVDRTVDELLAKALDITSDLLVTPTQKERISELFKEELYRYMYLNEATTVEAPYLGSKRSKLGAKQTISGLWKTDAGFENELEEILKQINRRIGGGIDDSGIIELKLYIAKQVDYLR